MDSKGDGERVGTGCCVPQEKTLPSNSAITSSRKPMTSRSEMRVDGGVNRKKSLRLLEGLESAHTSLAFSCGLMGVFSPIVEPVPAYVPDPGQYLRKSSRITPEPIGHDSVRDSTGRLHRMTKEAFRCGQITPLLYQDIDDLAVLIDCAP